MLVGERAIDMARPHERLYLQDSADERAEVLRRLRRQLEQAQRDLERATEERNSDAVIRLRYRIIPQLERQIRQLEHEGAPAPEVPVVSSCFEAVCHTRSVERGSVSRSLLPRSEHDAVLLEGPVWEKKGRKAPLVSTQERTHDLQWYGRPGAFL